MGGVTGPRGRVPSRPHTPTLWEGRVCSVEGSGLSRDMGTQPAS